jgi:hypothetical protein
MSLQKKYLKTKPICKVKFELPKEVTKTATRVCVVGEFNDWDQCANTMKKQKNGNFTTTLDLEPGLEYQFRYFIDDEYWKNDPNADKYIPNNLCGADNSVVII